MEKENNDEYVPAIGATQSLWNSRTICTFDFLHTFLPPAEKRRNENLSIRAEKSLERWRLNMQHMQSSE